MAAAKGPSLGSLGKLTELRQRIFFVIGALIVFRLGSFIPVPGVNPEAMTSLIESGGGLMNMVMGVFFLIGAVHGPRSKGVRWVYAAGAILGAIGGIATAARHLWIQTLPADQIPACGPNLGYMMDAFPMAKVLKMVFTGSGECAKVEPILGLPMPAWTLLWYVALLALVLVAATRRARQ